MQTWLIVVIVLAILLVFGGGILTAFNNTNANTNGNGSNKANGSCGSRVKSCSGGAANSDGKLILFHTTWCGYCKMVKPAWETLQNEYPDNVVSIDADDNSELKNKFSVDGYPSIIWAPNGLESPETAIAYKSGRDYESLKSFLLSKL